MKYLQVVSMVLVSWVH